MNSTNTRFTTTQILILFCSSVLVLLLSMYYRLGPELVDDGAFFLRYAENMLKGEFWVWNIGEAPVWGASAPLYPLLITLPMALGIGPEAAVIGMGFTLASISLAATAFMLGHRFGIWTGIAFLAFATLDSYMMWFLGSGLETPLTIALLTFAAWTLLYRPSAWIVGLAAGLLMVNKLDLVPAGGLLLFAHWIQEKKFPKIACILAAAIGLAWYGFAWFHFGAPVPNSFLTKSLHQNDYPKSIDWTWFGQFIFGVGIHKWMTGLTIFALLRVAGVKIAFAFFLVGMVLVHLVAYTLKYPFEPYNWYAMPAVYSMLIWGAIGANLLAQLINLPLKSGVWLGRATAFLVITVISANAINSEKLNTSQINTYTSYFEADRAEAGRWVEENTPKNFVVYSRWGHPAYYSHRKVLDGSFLNRRYEAGDLIERYRPEILILQGDSGTTPMNPKFSGVNTEHYRVVKVFDKTYSLGKDYFFGVLARKDAIAQISNIAPPQDLMSFVKDFELGDQFGTLRSLGVDTLFVHPGKNTPTKFSFSVAEYLNNNDHGRLRFYGRIANIPKEAIRRGAGNVLIRISQNEKQLMEAVVKVNEPFRGDIAVTKQQPLNITVENNGNADTDWLLLSIH
ncbi:hypothetical protein [Noviherbaspirillum massiliense]|uniref:hypothetical protein n=1 Tax=Noviherbaspirillum massiliense TaxID=1465823 RepID=UPI0002DD05A9|nr:hypothetical protein [Noviherbaspirillum massiliense]